MKYFYLTVERTQQATVLVKAPDATTAKEWLSDNVEQFEDNIDFEGWPDYSVSSVSTEAQLTDEDEKTKDCFEVPLDWLRDNGYEVVITVKRKEPV